MIVTLHSLTLHSLTLHFLTLHSLTLHSVCMAVVAEGCVVHEPLYVHTYAYRSTSKV